MGGRLAGAQGQARATVKTGFELSTCQPLARSAALASRPTSCESAVSRLASGSSPCPRSHSTFTAVLVRYPRGRRGCTHCRDLLGPWRLGGTQVDERRRRTA
ncbi:hypothetical protein BJV74DRAFT_864213 [Russula compacta]|nr:hypothetical protein BJV74DRAFT_864213 [Russula compacta]